MTALAGTSLEGVALAPDKTVSQAEIGLDKFAFYNTVMAEFVNVVEEIVGSEEADGYINIVASEISVWINSIYHNALGEEQFNIERIAHIISDMKSRVGGTYTVKSVSSDKIVIANALFLFGASAKGRRALCTLTSSVFGRLAAENTGYARIEHTKVDPSGGCDCEITIHFRPRDVLRPGEREYFRVGEARGS